MLIKVRTIRVNLHYRRAIGKMCIDDIHEEILPF